MRIPVRCNNAIVEMADEARVRVLSKAKNAELVRQRKSGRLVGIDLKDFGESRGRKHHGNPLKYSHNSETDQNPQGVWTLKRIPTNTAPIFRAVVIDCSKAA